MNAESQLVETNDQTKELQAAETPQGVSPLVAMLASGQLKAENVEDAFKLQRQHDEYEARKAFSVAMAKFRKMAPVLKKDKTVDFSTQKGRTHYTHTSLGYALSEVNPLLGECDLNLSWHPRQEGGTVFVKTRVTHILGHSEEIELIAAPDQSGNKNSIQAVQSTITYLQRAGAMSLLGLASGEDDDGRGAQPAAPAIEMIDESDMADLKAVCEEVEKDYDKWLAWISKNKNYGINPDGVLLMPKADKAGAVKQLRRPAK